MLFVVLYFVGFFPIRDLCFIGVVFVQILIHVSYILVYGSCLACATVFPCPVVLLLKVFLMVSQIDS